MTLGLIFQNPVTIIIRPIKIYSFSLNKLPYENIMLLCKHKVVQCIPFLQKGLTPADDAREDGHHKIVKLLESYAQKVCARITVIIRAKRNAVIVHEQSN